jgi:hypothetical protein
MVKYKHIPADEIKEMGQEFYDSLPDEAKVKLKKKGYGPGVLGVIIYRQTRKTDYELLAKSYDNNPLLGLPIRPELREILEKRMPQKNNDYIDDASPLVVKLYSRSDRICPKRADWKISSYHEELGSMGIVTEDEEIQFDPSKVSNEFRKNYLRLDHVTNLKFRELMEEVRDWEKDAKKILEEGKANVRTRRRAIEELSETRKYKHIKYSLSESEFFAYDPVLQKVKKLNRKVSNVFDAPYDFSKEEIKKRRQFNELSYDLEKGHIDEQTYTTILKETNEFFNKMNKFVHKIAKKFRWPAGHPFYKI